MAGGFPYSEGIYEDINKAIYAQFYWDPRARQPIRCVNTCDMSWGESVEPVSEAISILEQNLPRQEESGLVAVKNW